MPNFQKARAWSHASMRAACLLSGVAALALCSPVAAAKANTNAGQGNFYFFGDSNIGQGNFSAIVGSRYDDFYPNSSNNGFERDSNGLIWAEMLILGRKCWFWAVFVDLGVCGKMGAGDSSSPRTARKFLFRYRRQ